MKVCSGRRVAETLAAIALLMVATVLTRCAPKSETVIIKQPIVVEKTIVVKPTPIAPPGSKASKAVRSYRQEERSVSDSVGYPGATSDQIKEIYRSERAAHKATQHMIDRDGKATKQDQDDAHDAIDALRRAQQAPKANDPKQGTPEELKP